MKKTEAIRDYHSLLHDLWPHQKKEVEKFQALTHRALFFEMGTGKTRTAIVCYLQKCLMEGRKLNTLILCPKIMVETWKRELEKLLPQDFHSLIVPLTGDGTKRKRLLQLQFAPRIFITNIEALGMKDIPAMLAKKKLDFIIVDESHKLKDPKGIRFKALCSFIDDIKYRLILTGSPILNNYEDIWTQFRLLSKNILGDNFYKWRLQNFYNANSNKPFLTFPAWVIKPDSLPKIERLIHDNAGVAEKKNVMKYLPPLVRKEIIVELTDDIKRSYKEMEKHFVAEVNDEIISADIVITKMIRLQQLVNGIVTNQEGEVSTVPVAKHEAIKQLLTDLCPKHKVIVWANFTQCLKDVARICDELGLYFVTIQGGQSDKERQEAIDNFNNTKIYSVCVANQQAGGVGIGLQAASYMIYYSKDYRLEQDIQSEARAHRGGSEVHECITRIDLVTKGTIEEEITTALREKMKLGDIIRGVKERCRI